MFARCGVEGCSVNATRMIRNVATDVVYQVCTRHFEQMMSLPR